MKLPQLSLRDLFWLILVCAMGVGWWISRSQSLEEIERLQLQVEGLQTIAKYEKLLEQHHERLTAPPPKRDTLPGYFPVLVSAQHEAMIKEMADGEAKP